MGGLCFRDEMSQPGKVYQLRLPPGSLYIGNPAAYAHAVYDHSGRSFTLQCRLGYTKTEDGHHGFNPWTVRQEDQQLLSVVVASSLRGALISQHNGYNTRGLRLPGMSDLAEFAACIDMDEHGYLRHLDGGKHRPRWWH